MCGEQTQFATRHIIVPTEDQERNKDSKKTDAEGAATFEIGGNLAEIGDLSLEARPAGYVPQYYNWKPDTAPTSIPNQLTMRFQKGITIDGQIQDPSGNPIASATVELTMPATSAYSGGLHFRLGALTSDAQGRWRCDVAPEDLSRVYLRAQHLCLGFRVVRNMKHQEGRDVLSLGDVCHRR